MVFLQNIGALFLSQYHRWILWCPVFIGLGVALYFSLKSEPYIVFPGAGLIAVFALIVVLWRFFYIRVVLIALFCVVMGFTAGVLRTQNVGTPMLPDETGVVSIKGVVQSVDHEISGAKILLEAPKIEGIALDQTPRLIRIKLATKYGVPDTGDNVRLLGVLMPPSQPVSPRSYDFQRHMFFQGIGGTGYAVRQFELLDKAPYEKINSENMRETIKWRIQKAKGSDEAKAIFTALLTGERKLIPEKVWEDIRKSGIAHLLAISGLHIGLVAGFIFFIFRAILAAIPYTAIYWPVKKVSALAAFASIVFYCWLVGAPVSAERAVFMTGIVLFAILIDRVAISLRLAAFAAVIILILSPEMLFTPGFQMSFAAVVALIAFYEQYAHHFSTSLYRRGLAFKIASYFLATLITTVIASLATAPFALFHFQRVALLPGVLANLIAVPLTAFCIMPIGLLALVLMPFGLEQSVLGWGHAAIEVILHLAKTTADMEGSSLNASAWPQSALAVMVFGGLWAAIWTNRIRWLGFFIIAIGIFTAKDYRAPDILISSEGKLIAIHAGDGRLVLSDSRAERFVKNSWHSEYGRSEKSYWPDDGTMEEVGLKCDYMGCVYTRGDSQTTFPRTQMAAYQDCMDDRLVIAPQFYELPRLCKNLQTITRIDIKHNGAYALYWNGQGYDVETTRDVRGVRPWTNYGQ